MTEDELKTRNDALADLYEAAALKTAEPIVFDADERADNAQKN